MEKSSNFALATKLTSLNSLESIVKKPGGLLKNLDRGIKEFSLANGIAFI